MARRLRPVKDPVVFTLDGATVEAERGEPIAAALVASGRVALARSPKLHRPHGPSCFRGACDGCLARVDGEPNVVTCMRACAGGERVETQNVLGSRETDLLRATDWMFPQGLDHHRLFAGVPVASGILQAFARRLSGLGKLPDQVVRGAAGAPRDVEVLVAGGGPAGLAVATSLAAAGRRVLVVDDAPAAGGSLRAIAEDAGAARIAAAVSAGAELASGAVAAGVYDDRGVLVAERRGAWVARPRALVLATGVHDAVPPFPDGDLAGVLSARAAALLFALGIAPGDRVALVGDGAWADRVARAAEAAGVAIAARAPSVAGVTAIGAGQVRAIALEDGAQRRKVHVDAIVVDAPGSPAFELAEQAGAPIRFDPARGYAPELDADGLAAPGVWCTGELAGTGPDLGSIERHAGVVARSVLRALDAG